ncbi:MAG: hypothetical protein WC485_01220, partial [Opitutaceae bacterium]
MKTSRFLERVDTFLDAQWRGSHGPWPDKSGGVFVTISRETGSGGASLARMLTRKLNGVTPDDEVWNVF